MDYSTLFVGIDVSKLKHDIAIVNEHKKVVHKPFVISDSRQGYQYLVNKLNWLKQTYHTQRFKIGMEATGDYWKNLYHFLKNQSPYVEVTVINPVQTRAFAKSELRRAKTDAVNAKDMARYMVEKRPAASVARPLIYEYIKDIDTQIYAEKKQLTMSINKLRIELGKVAPEIEHATARLAGQQILALLKHYPTAESIASASVEQLCALRYGEKQWTLPMAFIMKIKTLAENSIAYKIGPGAGIVVQSLIRRIMGHQQEIDALQTQMIQLHQHIKPHKSVLASIPGISCQTAIVLEAYIGDVKRFASAKQMVAYFGMNPTINRSGKSIKRVSYLEKKGSGIVRHKLFMAVLTNIRHKRGPIYEYYKRLVAAGKSKLVAIGAAMRKLLVIIYTMLKNQTEFDPNKK